MFLFMSYNDYLANFWGKVPYSGGIHGVKPARKEPTCCIIFHLIFHHLSMSPSLILTRLRPTMQLSTETILDYYTAYTSADICTKASFLDRYLPPLCHLIAPRSTRMNTMSAHWMSRKPAVSGLPPNTRLINVRLL